jgi:hypothetical protein
MLSIIGLLERQICTELLLYTNLPYYLAVMYCLLDRTPRTLYTLSIGGNGILTVDYNPDAAEEYKFYSKEVSPTVESGFSVYGSHMTLKQTGLQTFNKEYIYSRNKKLLAGIEGLAEEYDKKPSGLPFYLVLPYLFFNQEKAIAATSNGHTVWLRYDHIKRSLKIKSFFSKKYYEKVPDFDLAKAYMYPITCNVLWSCSQFASEMFPDDALAAGSKFPAAIYHIYKAS